MAKCKACGAWFSSSAPVELCPACERALRQLNGYAMPVVRCKDCIGKAHWYKNDYGCTICGMSGLFGVEDSDFCSYGERREDDA